MANLIHPPVQVPDGHIPPAPVALSALGAAIIAWAIVNIYSTAIDAVLLSFLEDEHMNGDEGPSEGRVTFCSEHMSKFMSATKSVAEAAEAYEASVRDAKTARIWSGKMSEERTHDMTQRRRASQRKVNRERRRLKRSRRRQRSRRGSRRTNPSKRTNEETIITPTMNETA